MNDMFIAVIKEVLCSSHMLHGQVIHSKECSRLLLGIMHLMLKFCVVSTIFLSTEDVVTNIFYV